MVSDGDGGTAAGWAGEDVSDRREYRDPRLTDTNQFGFYRFDEVVSGQYRVSFDAPNGTSFVTDGIGTETLDSDVTDPSNGESDLFSVIDNETVAILAGVDAANAGVGSVAGFVFRDTNGNDQYDAGDGLVAGDTVNLIDVSSGLIVASEQTVSPAWFRFDDVAAGGYQLQFLPLYTADFVSPDIGPDSTDSDVVEAENGLTDVFEVNRGDVVRIQAGLSEFDAI